MFILYPLYHPFCVLLTVLCVFYFLDQDIGFETSQQGISEDVSVCFEGIRLFPRDDLYSILEEFWQDDKQTGRDKENQNKHLSPIIFTNKDTLANKGNCDYKKDIGEKFHVNTNLVPSRKQKSLHSSRRKLARSIFFTRT